MNNLELVKYPIGRFTMPTKISDGDMQEYIRLIGNLPSELAHIIENFDDAKFSSQYRENGWTVQQVITHIAESHSRAYAMFKHGLAQNNIKVITDNEKEVSTFGNNQIDIVQQALKIIFNSHENWVLNLNSMSESEKKLTFFYPDAGRQIPLAEFLAIFAWHGKHHSEQINGLKKRMGW